MARVFVSSTFEDLAEYRAAAMRVLRQLGHHVVAMEDYIAADQRPLEAALHDIASSDLFVGILGRRYGYIPAQSMHSLTELEYRHARQMKKPTLMFLVADDAEWPTEFTDQDQQRIRTFRDAVVRDRVVSYFRSREDFTAALITAIGQINQGPRPGPPLPSQQNLPLAWYLVADFKATPDLLQHMDPSALQAALAKWEQENGVTAVESWSARVDAALEALRSKQPHDAPSALWLAWMRATRAPTESPGLEAAPNQDTAPEDEAPRNMA